MKLHYRLIIFSLLSIFSVHAKNIFVSTTGDNTSGTGTISLPYKTIQKASNEAIPGDVIQVREGLYREEVNIVSDGVTFQPYNNEVVTINGADLLTSWALTTGNTYQTTMNWDVDAKWGSNQVFCDSKMIELARWPDQTSADIVMPTNALADRVTAVGNIVTIMDAAFNEPDGRWAGAQLWINLSRHGNDGQGRTFKIISTNAALHTITIDFGGEPVLEDAPWGLGKDSEYFLFNPTANGVANTGGVDALLSNGEWWKNGNILYVKTPNGAMPNASAVGTNVIESKKRHFAFWASIPKSNYTIKGFNLFGCSITTDSDPFPQDKRAKILESAHDIVIDGITAKYVSHQTDMSGNYQDQFYYGAGIVLRGRNNIIRNSNIQFSATAALIISGFGNKALNNTIANTNYFCANAGALNTSFVCYDAEIAYNTIYNTTIMGINFTYAKNSDITKPDAFRIHHNTIYNFMRRSGDSGAIDEVSANLQWGRIDHNIIYNTTPVTGGMIHGIYLDFGENGDITNLTIDHNIVFDVPSPIFMNSCRFVNIYNNIALSLRTANDYGIKYGNGASKGADNKIYNNISSNGINNLDAGVIRNNIITNNSSLKATDLFVDVVNHDFRLKPTATVAIDKGIFTGNYEVNVIGLPDIGAIEHGTIIDTEAPTVPTNLNANTITNTSFTLNWDASVDNVQVTEYKVYINGEFFKSTPNTSLLVSNLTPATDYTVSVEAKDFYNNTSSKSTTINASTVSYPGVTLHLEPEKHALKYGGIIDKGVWSGYKTNSFIQFNNVILSQQSILKVRVACITQGCQIEARLNSTTGTLIGTFTATTTANIDAFEIQTTTLNNVPIGAYNLVFVIKNNPIYSCSLDWIELAGGMEIGAIPTTPFDLNASVIGAKHLNLKWVGSIDDVAVTTYEVFRNGVLIGKTAVNYMLIDGLSPSTNYSFTVRAGDADNNWSAQTLPIPVTTSSTNLKGIVIGSDGHTFEGDKNTVFDGNINSFYDCEPITGAWAGLILPVEKSIARILIYPRPKFEYRLIGGVFQGSNTADFSSGVVNLHTVSNEPKLEWTEITVDNPGQFKYIRYKAPRDSYGNIAEIEFYEKFTSETALIDTYDDFQLYPNPTSTVLKIKNMDRNSIVSITSVDGKLIYFKTNIDNDELSIAVSEWAKGFYFVKVQNNKRNTVKKIIVN